MNIAQTVKINRQIMKLIKSKYTELFPAAYSTTEARYYKLLRRHTDQAIEAMEHGGLALPPDTDQSAHYRP
jgi:hypothetical protein